MKTEIDRRKTIIEKIELRCLIEYRGFEINGRPSPCHIWTGPTSGDGRGGGYGRMSLNGQTVAVHLVVYTHYYGFIPGKKQIDHLCNQRLCCNPQHLEMVSHIKNQKRRAARASSGKDNLKTQVQDVITKSWPYLKVGSPAYDVMAGILMNESPCPKVTMK